MRNSFHFLALPAVLMLAGCVSAHTTMLTPNRYAPVPAPDVHVYLDESELPEECVRLALIHAEGNANWTNERQMIEAARKKAGTAGGNALVLRSMRDPSTVTRIASEVFDGVPADRKGQMLAFRCPPSDRSAEDGEPIPHHGGW
jgi:hypothetical protein